MICLYFIIPELRKLVHKATAARMKVEKRALMVTCDKLCVEYVSAFTKPTGDHTNNTHPDHGYYVKQFTANSGTLRNGGCDECDEYDY